jgi:hypothetical protein
MPTKYFLLSGNIPMDHIPGRVLSSRIVNLEKLEETHQVAIEMTMKQQSNLAKRVHQHYKQKSFQHGDHVLWFSKSKKTHIIKFK